MKKLISILIVLGGFALILQFFVHFFTNAHQVDYSLKVGDNSYLIHEDFKKSGGNHLYTFLITDQSDHTYVFNYSKDLDKQREIIRDIKYYKKGDLECIFPIYKRSNTGDVACNLNNQPVSYAYLKQSKNSDLTTIISRLEEDGYSAPSWKDAGIATTEERNLNIYYDNISEDMVFTIWSYQGIYIIKSDGIVRKDFLNKDQYENTTALLVDDVYVIFDTDSANMSYNQFYLYDVVHNGKTTFPLDTALSKDSYIQGEYDGKLYYVDNDSKKQYSLDPLIEKVEEVGNKEKGFLILEDGKLKTISSVEFFENEFYFTNQVENSKLEKKYQAIDIRKEGRFYYFRTESGDFYRVFEENLDHPLLLFHFDQVSEWKLKDDGIILVSDNSLYFYDDVYGLLSIAEYNELLYNYKNICDFTRK